MSDWREIEDTPPPKGEMIIWARPKGNGKWGLGLAYLTVSGHYSDSEPPWQPINEHATHWKPIGPPPGSRA